MTTEEQYAVRVVRGDGSVCHIGPTPFHHVAEHMTWAFEQMRHNTSGAAEATWSVVPYDEGTEHLPLVPAWAGLLSELMDDPVQGVGDGIKFPDLWSRLEAQHGWEEAADAWKWACWLYDEANAEEESDVA